MTTDVGEALHSRLLNFHDAASYCGVRPTTIRRLMERGVLPTVRLPLVRRVLFDRLDLDRLIEGAKSIDKETDGMPLAAVGVDEHGQG